MLFASSRDALKRALTGVAVEIQGSDYSEVAYEAGNVTFMSFILIDRTDNSLFYKCLRRQTAVPRLRIIFALPLQEWLPIASLLPFSLFCHAVAIYQRHNLVSARPGYLESSRQRVLSSNSHHFNDNLASPKPFYDGTRVDFRVSWNQ